METRGKVVAFFYNHLKVYFRNMNVTKHQHKFVYDLYEYLKQKIMIKDKY